MGYLLRGLRVASYLAVAMGILLIIGAIINNATFFYGIRLLFIGVVGIGATSLLRDRFLEGAEEEEYHSLLPKPQKKVKEGLLIGSVSGFIGVMVGGFATTIVLMMQTEARGYDADGMEYIFAAVCFWPFPFGAPLLGALLGALGGYLTSFVFSRTVVAVIVGFVIGVLVGVIAIIGFLDVQSILELWQ